MCQLLTDVFHYIKNCKALKFAQKNAQLFSFNDISNRKYFISNKREGYQNIMFFISCY